MDIFFTDPNDIPLPPEEVRIRSFRVEPWPDKRRVRVLLEFTPFQKGPNSEIEIHNADGDEVASLTIIETINPKMDLTIHLRGGEPSGLYTASIMVYYYEAEEQSISAKEDPTKAPLPPLPSRIKRVDQAETTFQI
jgi:hypothetical protein